MPLAISRAAMLGALVSLAALTAHEADARGARGGGGFRGGASTSMSRGGGGGGGGGFSRSGNYSRPSGGASASQRPAGGGNRTASAGQRPSQLPSGGNRTNINGGDRNNINNGNINTGDVNINRNVHVDNSLPGRYNGGWRDYPIGAGIAIGAVAGMTAAAIGSAYYALPPACSPYPWHTYTYYYCGSVYYRPQYQGDTIVYVVVEKPK